MPAETEIQAWIDKAQSDLISAGVLLNNQPPINDTAVFHAAGTVVTAQGKPPQPAHDGR